MMLRSRPRFKQARRKRTKGASNYERMMKTLLLQNQQLIIQQSNVMFIMMKQLSQANMGQLGAAGASAAPGQPASPLQSQQLQHLSRHISHQHQNQPHQLQHQHQQQQEPQPQPTRPQQLPLQPQHQQLTTHQYHQLVEDATSIHPNDLFSQAHSADIHPQQVASRLQENLGNYLTPAASEQDPISDKPEDDDLAALLEGNGLLQNNLLYNPQTDIGSVTPYKSQQQQHQTPSYYSSGCESLTTPRVDQQKQTPTINVSQNVVKNLADSFKSPSKPKINVQILSGSATGCMKNSKAKIIQRMNISEFLRHVHPETGEPKKNAT